ncbi:MAG TPA: hypothetical protein VFK94_03345 [Patescibacteria group bacterium]|nr:hypothetical protein [Patescibacteria group bacterium]
MKCAPLPGVQLRSKKQIAGSAALAIDVYPAHVDVVKGDNPMEGQNPRTFRANTGIEEIDSLLRRGVNEISLKDAEDLILSAVEGLAPSDMTDAQLMILHSSLLAVLNVFTADPTPPSDVQEIAAVTRSIVIVLIELAGEMNNRPEIMKNMASDREAAWEIVRLAHKFLLASRGRR